MRSRPSGATPLHLAAAAGNPDAVGALLDKGADANAREPEWGQTPLVFAAEYDRAAAIKALLKHGADPSIHTNGHEPHRGDGARAGGDEEAQRSAHLVRCRRNGATRSPRRLPQPLPLPRRPPVDGTTAARRRFGGGQRRWWRQRGGPAAQGSIHAGADSGGDRLRPRRAEQRGGRRKAGDGRSRHAERRRRRLPRARSAAWADFTALHHAVRQGNVEAVMALLDGGADINDTSSVDHTTPLLMATINGQFDVAMKLIERGAEPEHRQHGGHDAALRDDQHAVGAASRAIRSRRRCRTRRRRTSSVMEALLEARARIRTRGSSTQPWYFAFNNCGNANCGLENLEGTTAFWRAAYASTSTR